MKKRLLVLGCVGCWVVWGAQASRNLERAREMERAGDLAGARNTLSRAADAAPGDATALYEYAEFLDRYADPGRRPAYRKLLDILTGAGNRDQAAVVARRLAILDLLAGDREAATVGIERFRAAGGEGLAVPPTWRDSPEHAASTQYVVIPGPLRSFARMAAFSPDAPPEQVLASFARNVVMNGYQASGSSAALEQTEYLKLVIRYLSQAGELEKLAGPEKVIQIPSCDSPQTGELLRILGYRMRGGCGSEVVLETVNATRAFLTADSGFPLLELEQALRTNQPFRQDYRPSRIPVLLGDYWRGNKESTEPLSLDLFVSDPSLCRLYLGLAKLEPETSAALAKSVSLARLKAFAHVLDFFGGMFQIRGGKAVVPGGARSAAAWGELAGVSPDQGPAFFERLIARDDGWLASYFDALARIEGPALNYLAEPARLKRFYTALRGRVTSPGPARPVFRSNADLLLLTARLQLEPDGRPHIPGGLETWKRLFSAGAQKEFDSRVTRAASGWKDQDELIEALFGFCRRPVENVPLKIFMILSDLDRSRPTALAPATVDRLARQFAEYGDQYVIFNDAPGLTDASILKFLDTAEAVSHIRDQSFSADVAGTMQALVGLWRILAREGAIPAAQADRTFAEILAPFAAVRGARELFDAGQRGVGVLLEAGGPAGGREPQEQMIALLSGGGTATDEEAQAQVAQEIQKILEAQRIVSLNGIFALSEHLDALARGEKMNPALVSRVAGRLAAIPAPRGSLSAAEKSSNASGLASDRHLDQLRKTNLRSAIEKAGGDKEKLRDARGLLAPVLRDTLMALNYAHYAPPGAQILYTNPVFVRTHEFQGLQGTSNRTWKATEVMASGWPANAGGRLTGSLAGLAYALANAEQNFLVPGRTQALIWNDLVPQLLISATIPRWWRVTPAQMHWLGLHVRYAETLFAAAAFDPQLRVAVMDAFARRASPVRAAEVAGLLERGEVKSALDRITPSELFAIGGEFGEHNGPELGPCPGEIRRLAAEIPEQVNPAAISRAFGTPKPTLATSYRPELLNLRTFPTLMGYSSRILAESWESNTLFWAELADEIHLAPAQLNVRIPQWTQALVERIFASHLDDWPAMLRSLREVGEDVRARTRSEGVEQKAALQ